MTANDAKIILVFAECNMNIAAAAKKLFMHRNTVLYHLEKIHKATGHDPRKFYDLIFLASVAHDRL